MYVRYENHIGCRLYNVSIIGVRPIVILESGVKVIEENGVYKVEA